MIMVAAALSMALLAAQPDRTWLHVYRSDHAFHSISIDSLAEMRHFYDSIVYDTIPAKPQESLIDPFCPLDSIPEAPPLYTLLPVDSAEMVAFTTHSGARMAMPVAAVDSIVVGTNVPAIHINIPGAPSLSEVPDRENYLSATISIDGCGSFDDLEPTAVSIRGRGNSTWGFAKKPYRLKFSKKTSLLDFKAAKSYALIANYIDPTHMRNAVALHIAQAMEMPFTNHCRHVRVYFNGIDKGLYMLTEKIGMNSTSVDLDEQQAVLFEMDANFDEQYQFRTTLYLLPVMIKDPDVGALADSLGTTPEELVNNWAAEFKRMERNVYLKRSLDDMIDWESLVDYVLVCNVCCNSELSWPNSVYVYKSSATDPLHFGPIWDFDWAFTYDNGEEGRAPERMLLNPWATLRGERFFRALVRRQEFRERFAERWDYFVANVYPELLEWLDDYARTIEPAAKADGVLWAPEEGRREDSFDHAEQIRLLRAWIEGRVAYCSTHPNWAIYEDN